MLRVHEDHARALLRAPGCIDTGVQLRGRWVHGCCFKAGLFMASYFCRASASRPRGVPRSGEMPNRTGPAHQVARLPGGLRKLEIRSGCLKNRQAKGASPECLGQGSLSSRDLAQVAGKVISLSPAVAPAALHSRAFFQAIKGHISWDALFPNPAEVCHTLQFWLDKIDGFNGRPWRPKLVALQAVVDASGVGFGGVLSAPRSAPVRFQGTFLETEAAGSSTLHEVLGYVGAVQLAAQLMPGQLAGAASSSRVIIRGPSPA
jgi:hypothetical protein